MTAVTECFYSALSNDADLAELIELFVQELPERLANLERCLDQGNWPELARFSHQLKGAGGSYGFPQLTPVAAQLEQLAKQAVADNSQYAAIDKLQTALNDLTAVAVRLRAGIPELAS